MLKYIRVGGRVHKLADHITPDGERQPPVGTLRDELYRAMHGIEPLPLDEKDAERLAVTLLHYKEEFRPIIEQVLAAGDDEPEAPESQGGDQWL